MAPRESLAEGLTEHLHRAPGAGVSGNVHRTTSGQAWALKSQGQHLAVSMLRSLSRNLSKSIPVVHPGGFWEGGHHSPPCTSLPGGQHVHTPPVSREASKETEWLEQPGLTPV